MRPAIEIERSLDTPNPEYGNDSNGKRAATHSRQNLETLGEASTPECGNARTGNSEAKPSNQNLEKLGEASKLDIAIFGKQSH